MLAVVMAGFGWSLGTGNYNDVVTPLPGYILLHAAVLLAWFVWLVLQTSLVRGNNVALHRKTGIAGIFIGLLVILTAPKVFLSNPQRIFARGMDWTSDMSQFAALGVEGRAYEDFAPMVIFGSISNIINFAILLGAALWWRKTPAIHKRLMLLASIAIFAPALARIARWPGLGGEDGLFLPIAILAVLVTPLLHDKLAEGRFHKATLAGVALIITTQIGAQVFARTEAAHAFVRSLL